MPVIRNARRSLIALLLACAALYLLVSPAPAHAACSIFPATVELGAHPSTDIAATFRESGGSSGLRCTGSLISIASTNTVVATVTGSTYTDGGYPALYNATTGDRLPFVLCKTAACGTVYDMGDTITWQAGSLIDILGLFTSINSSLPIHIRTLPGRQLAKGTYQTTLSLGWQWDLCAAGALGLCVWDRGSATSTVTVRITVTEDCVMSAEDIDFGSAAFPTSLPPATASILAACTKGSSYTVGIGNGQNYTTNRRMTNGSAYIGYELYFPVASSARWGPVPPERVASINATQNGSTLDGTTMQRFTLQARVLPGQAPVPAGSYSDRLIVDIAF